MAILILGVLGGAAFIFSNTNLFKGTFLSSSTERLSEDLSTISEDLSTVKGLKTDLDLPSILTVSKGGDDSAVLIDWDDSTTEVIMGNWTVSSTKKLKFDEVLVSVGEPEGGLSPTNTIKEYFSNSTLNVNDGSTTTEYVLGSNGEITGGVTLEADTSYSFEITGTPDGPAGKQFFEDAGHNTNELAFRISSFTLINDDGTDGDSYSLSTTEDAFSYEEVPTTEVLPYTYGGYKIQSDDYDDGSAAEPEPSEPVTGTYNIQVSVYDPDLNNDRAVSGLESTNFKAVTYIAGMTSDDFDLATNEITAVSETSTGVYLLTVPAESEYLLTVTVDGFADPITENVPAKASGSEENEDYKLNYKYLLSVYDTEGNKVSGATVNAGDDYGEPCEDKSYENDGATENAGIYACVIPSTNSTTDFQVSKDGYTTTTGSFELKGDELYELYGADVTLETASPATEDTWMLQFDLTDAFGRSITGLDVDSLALMNIASGNNDVSTVSETADGQYLIVTDQTATADYYLYVDGYVMDKNNTYTSTNVSGDYTEEVMDYAYYVNVQDEDGNNLAGASVLAGDSYQITCVDSSTYASTDSQKGYYGCAVPLYDLSPSYKVTLSGYENYAGSFTSDRTIETDDNQLVIATLTEETETTTTETSTDTTTDTTTSTSTTDSDGDGLSDTEEASIGTDPDDTDTDDDGLSDYYEEYVYKTEPLDTDSDDDGISDKDEVKVYGTDPLDADTDNDGYLDYMEIVAGYDPLSSSNSSGSTSSSSSSSTSAEISKQLRAEILADASYNCDDPFTDTEGHWAEDTICRLYQADIVSGRSYSTFAPNDQITRAEFLKMALLNAGYELDDADGHTESYQDVSSSDWYYPYVVIGERVGALRNQGGNFSPNSNITRADAILLAVRIAKQTLYGFSQSDIPFSDVVTSDYFAYAVIIANNTSADVPNEGETAIIEGYSDDTFRPKNYITRAEVAAITIRSYIAWYK